MKTLFFAVLSLWLPTLAFSNNNFFMPGDAFFPTSLTENELQVLADSDAQKHEFTYDSYRTWEGAFCGNAGFTSAACAKIDKRFVANLVKTYNLIREDYPKEIVEIKKDGDVKRTETNPIRVLFYRADFPYKSLAAGKAPRAYLGIRYNENWVEESVKFGHSRHRVRMCSLIRHQKAPMICWRDSSHFPGLQIEIPKRFNYRTALRADSNTPVKIVDDIKAIVLPPEPLLEYFRFDTGSYLTYPGEIYLPVYVVTSGGIKKIELHHDPFKFDDNELDGE